jgi:hypothetical protein
MPRQFWGYWTGEEYKGGTKVYELNENADKRFQKELKEHPEDFTDPVHLIEHSALAELEQKFRDLESGFLNLRMFCLPKDHEGQAMITHWLKRAGSKEA